VGALKSILKKYPQGYDVFSGVSVGALISGFLSTYPKEQESKAVQDLEELWLGLTKESVYKAPNFFTEAYRTFNSRGILNNSPMITLLKKTLGGKKIMRHAVVGVTDFSTGNYLTYYLQEISE